MLQIVPFPIGIPEQDFTDLHRRLDLSRLPEPQTVPDAGVGRADVGTRLRAVRRTRR